MALQDLTPQLRTRLNRVEKAVGWFVLLAVALLLFGFGYYAYNTAQRKGWFIQKVNYQTSLNNAAGLKKGDPVMLMGFPVGQITDIVPNDPYDWYGVTVYFNVRKADFGYIWSDSKVKAAAADFLGKRVLEVTKGLAGVPTVAETTNKVAVGVLNRTYLEERLQSLLDAGTEPRTALAQLNDEALRERATFYTDLADAAPYWIEPDESPAITERLDQIVTQVENALPKFLAFTNQLSQVLSNSADVTANLGQLSSNLIPVSADLGQISGQLREPGSLGEWAMGTNFPAQVQSTVAGTQRLVANTDSNLMTLTLQIGDSLESLAEVTSNLNWQVEQNTNMLSSISEAVVHADELVQGLKRHWLLRSAFRDSGSPESNSRDQRPLRSPRDAEQHR